MAVINLSKTLEIIFVYMMFLEFVLTLPLPTALLPFHYIGHCGQTWSACL